MTGGTSATQGKGGLYPPRRSQRGHFRKLAFTRKSSFQAQRIREKRAWNFTLVSKPILTSSVRLSPSQAAPGEPHRPEGALLSRVGPCVPGGHFHEADGSKASSHPLGLPTSVAWHAASESARVHSRGKHPLYGHVSGSRDPGGRGLGRSCLDSAWLEPLFPDEGPCHTLPSLDSPAHLT